MDTSETSTGERERAPVEAAMDSGVPNYLVAKYRLGDFRLAFVTDKDDVKGHGQWLRSVMTEKIDAHTRGGNGAPFAMGSGGPVLSAWVVGKCNRVLGQELTEAEERAHAHLARKAQARELEAWGQFKVFSPVKMGAQSEEIVDTLWAPTCRGMDGMKTAKARLVAMVYQNPDLRNGNADIAGRVSRRSCHLQRTSLGALRNGRWGASL